MGALIFILMDYSKKAYDLLVQYTQRTDKLEDTMKREFQNVHARIDSLDARMDEGFAKVDERLNKIDDRLDKMDQRFDRMDQKFDAFMEKHSDHDRRITILESK